MVFFICDYNIKYYSDKILIYFYLYDGFIEDSVINKFQTSNLIKEGFSAGKVLKSKTLSKNFLGKSFFQI